MNSEGSVKPCPFFIRNKDTYFLDGVSVSAAWPLHLFFTVASIIPPPCLLHCATFLCLPTTVAQLWHITQICPLLIFPLLPFRHWHQGNSCNLVFLWFPQNTSAQNNCILVSIWNKTALLFISAKQHYLFLHLGKKICFSLAQTTSNVCSM